MDDAHTIDKPITQSEAADILCVSPRTLETWRVKGIGPRYLQYSSRCIRYLTSEVLAWREGQIRRSTSDKNATSMRIDRRSI